MGVGEEDEDFFKLPWKKNKMSQKGASSWSVEGELTGILVGKMFSYIAR